MLWFFVSVSRGGYGGFWGSGLVIFDLRFRDLNHVLRYGLRKDLSLTVQCLLY